MDDPEIIKFVDTKSTTKQEEQFYNFKFAILGHEVLAFQIGTSSTTDRWVAISLVSVFSVLIILGAYADKFANMFAYIKSMF